MSSGEALRSMPSVSYGSFTAASARSNIRGACRWLDRGAAHVGPSVIRSAALVSDREQRHRLGALNRGSGKVSSEPAYITFDAVTPAAWRYWPRSEIFDCQTLIWRQPLSNGPPSTTR